MNRISINQSKFPLVGARTLKYQQGLYRSKVGIRQGQLPNISSAMAPFLGYRGSIVLGSPKLFSILEGVSSQGQDLILRAREKVRRASEGEIRLSERPKFEHYENVAYILRNLFRIKTGVIIAAGYLHDYIEDMVEKGKGTMDELYNELVGEFGADVADLVLGVTKFSVAEAAAAGKERESFNFLRLLKYFAENFGVLAVKLADNIDNSADQDPFPREKQIEHAGETTDYAKLANASGVWAAKRALEDNALKSLRPEVYKALALAMEGSVDKTGKGALRPIIENLYEKLGAEWITAAIESEPRNVSETLKIIEDSSNLPKKIFEANRLVILVENEDACFRALRILHRTYRHVKGKMEDRVTSPLPNGYQAFLTDVTIPGLGILNVVIQTEAMHAWGEYGPISSHHREPGREDWYKTDYGLRKLLMGRLEEGQKKRAISRSLDEIDSRVIVFTPEMDVHEVAEGSSNLRYAFGVHTDFGMWAIAVESRQPGKAARVLLSCFRLLVAQPA